MSRTNFTPRTLIRKQLAVTLASMMVIPASWAQAPTGGNTPSAMPKMVVSAAGYEQELKQAPASITVITGESLASRQVSSLAEALEGVEGVNVRGLDSRDGKTGNQSISLRGLPREYTLVLINGVRQNPMGNITPNSLDDAHSGFLPPIGAIERIEVIRGPMATLYGSDALGGVVNIITRRPTNEWRFGGSVSNTLQGDSDFGDKTAIEAHVSGAFNEQLSMQLYGRYYERQRSTVEIPGVTTPRTISTDTPTMGQNPGDANISTVGGQLLFTPNQQHELSLSFNVSEQEYSNKRGEIRALHRTGNPANSACNTATAPNFCRGYADTVELNRNQITLGYQGNFDVGLFEFKATRDMLEHTGRTIPLGSGLALDKEGTARKLELETWIVDTKFITPLNDTNLLTIGAQHIDPEMTDGLWGNAKNSVRQYSVFAENEWQASSSLTLTGGLRYDDNDSFSGNWSPRAYAVWNATDSWTIKGGVGRGFRTPYLEQLTDGIIGYGNQGTVALYGNPNLKPETSTNYEVSALYNAGPLSAQATLFVQDLDNLIERGTAANSGTLNVGEARVQGVELSSTLAINDALALSGNYTFIDSEVTKTQLDTGSPALLISSRQGDPLVSVPEHMLNAKLSWQLNDKVETYIAGEYRSSSFRPHNYHEPHSGGNSQGQVAQGVRDSRAVMGDFKGYSQFNLGATYRINRNLTLSGVIYNLFDKDFKDYKTFNLCGNAACSNAAGSTVGYSNVYNTILEPRRLHIALNAEF